MTLQSEHREVGTGKYAAETEIQDVAPLIFESLAMAEIEVDGVAGRNEEQAGLIEQLTLLESRLRSQSLSLPAQLENARQQAKSEARAEWEVDLEQQIASERAVFERVCEQFNQERTRYFAAVERQVVKLSLAIAERVLHREAMMDPLLLSGAVRVALEKIQDESEIVLRVPAEDIAEWTSRFDRGSEGKPVRIVADEKLQDRACVLETIVGSIELGIGVQLAEIERGFFDLLQARPV
jgi:flagellar assembly protein FliH